MCKKIIILIFIFSTFNARSQDPLGTPPLKSRLMYGGTFSLSFGTTTYISLEPSCAFVLNKNQTNVGIGGIFNFIHDKSYNISSWALGAKCFVTQPFLKYFLLHTEYQALNLDAENYVVTQYYPEGRFWYHALFIGGGIRQSIGKKSYVYILLLYDVLYTPNSPYINPQFRIGFFI